MALLLPALLACSDYDVNLHGKDGAAFDSGTAPDVDTDDSTETTDTTDSDPSAGACTLTLGAAGTVDLEAECAPDPYTAPSDPWDVVREWRWTDAEGIGATTMPAVGYLTDDNGDGRYDEEDLPVVVFTTTFADTLVAVAGDGTELFAREGFDGYGGVAIADVDGDGAPEIVVGTTDHRVAAVDATGATEWTSDVFDLNIYPQPTVGDLDGDGEVEIVFHAAVVEGTDGRTRATLDVDPNTYSIPTIADLDQDGEAEIVLAGDVFDSSGRLLWTGGVPWFSSFTAVLDVDGDSEGEVLFVNGQTAAIHDASGFGLVQWSLRGGNGNGAGPPAVADLDGDGAPEIAVPYGDTIAAYELDGTVLWTAAMHDASMGAGCSAWDVDGDGAYEVLLADEEAFRIYDGRTGDVRFETTDHVSLTEFEYPTVADVDGDGSAEILVADNDDYADRIRGVTAWGHADDAWPPAGPAWAVHDYGGTNVDADGHVPASPVPSWQAGNRFRARPGTEGDNFPDLRPSITDVCVDDCDAGPVRLAVQVANAGGADVPAGTPLSVYAEDGSASRLVATVTLPAVPSGALLAGIEVDLAPEDAGLVGFRVAVEGGPADECDPSDDADTWEDVLCP